MMRVHPDWYLTPQRAAIHIPTKTAVIADVHLGYNESRQRKGDAVPVVSFSSLVEPLKLLTDAGVRNIVVAGDLLESPEQVDLARLFIEHVSQFSLTVTGIVPGNHDGDLSALQHVVPVCKKGLRLGEWTVQHDNQTAGGNRIVHGHAHPCVRRNGSNVPCFLFGPNRLILPAYSPDAAGVNIKRIPRTSEYACYAILKHGVCFHQSKRS